ncbi:hypothetical protein, partial [Staphylococcus aureus]
TALNQFGTDVYVQGHYAYLTESNPGNVFEIWDISNPAIPARVASTSLAATPGAVVVQGRYAYFSDIGSKIEVWDVASSTNPFSITEQDLSNAGGSLFVQGRYAYLAD